MAPLPSRTFFHPKDKKLPDLYPLIHPLRRLLALGRGIILILGFPPTLAIDFVGHSIPLGGVGRSFPFTEDETRTGNPGVTPTLSAEILVLKFVEICEICLPFRRCALIAGMDKRKTDVVQMLTRVDSIPRRNPLFL